MAAAKEQQQTKKAMLGVIKLYSLPFLGMLISNAYTFACDLTVHLILDRASWMMALVAGTRCWSQSSAIRFRVIGNIENVSMASIL